jgi:hypothetical protein
VRPGFALALAAGLTAAGVVAAAGSGGRRALRVALPLAGTVWAYDLRVKSGPGGPAAMAAARGLDVLLGAGGDRRGWPAAGAVATHVAAVTMLSTVETVGGAGAERAARSGLAGTAAVTALAAGATATAPGRGPLPAALLAGYAAAAGRGQLAAAHDPRPATVQRAVGAGILALIPLQAGLLAAAGARRLGCGLAALWPVARLLSRRVSPT